MSRVLITGGAGPLGAAIAKRLLGDPAYDVRISDRRDAPPWMREGCEMHRGDLRVAAEAMAAAKGCSHAIHLAGFEHGAPEASEDGARAATVADPPHTLLEYESALHGAVIRAAIDRRLERFLYVSSALVFEQAEEFPTPEEHLSQCPPPCSARGFARLSGERSCAAAHAEHGLEYSICRPFGAYGGKAETTAAPTPLSEPASELDQLIELAVAGELPLLVAGEGERTVTPTHVEDLAEGIVATLGSPAGANEDFNMAATGELSLAEIAQISWRAGGADREELPLEQVPTRKAELRRSAPSVHKALELLGWRARTEAMQGITAAATAARERAAREQMAPAVSE
jgi:nucleoside-diphosphate-sugar epimerase